MNTRTACAEPGAPPTSSPAAQGLLLLLATACGLTAANIYYPQPLVGPIGADLHLSDGAAGLVVTLTQLGYGLGLLLVVPLGDLLENRRLVVTLLGIAAVALGLAGVATHPGPFLAAAFLIGIGTVAVQVLVPYAAHLVPEASRGRAVGQVMSGLALGIMMARPVSSLVAQFSSWRVMFYLSSAAMVLLGGVLAMRLPVRRPETGLHYGQLLASMGRIVRTTPLLRRRALYQAGQFGAFSLFWTTTPLLLAGPAFRLSQGEIALFALAGVAGAVAAPLAGRVADRGWTRPATALSMLAVAAAFLMTHIAEAGTAWSLGLLVVAAIVLDFGVSANMMLGQRAIFGLNPAYRARLNGLYMTTFFLGGAVGSALGGWTYAHGGWLWASSVGVALPVLTLVYFSTER